MCKKICSIILAFSMMIISFSVSAKVLVTVPHIYSFDDSKGTLYDKLPSDGTTAQWNGWVTDNSQWATVSDTEVDLVQGRVLKLVYNRVGHSMQHNLSPYMFKTAGAYNKIAFSYAMKIDNSTIAPRIALTNTNNVSVNLLRMDNNNGKLAIKYTGKWQTGTNTDGTPIFENAGAVGDRCFEWNGEVGAWFYANFLIDLQSGTYKVALQRIDGSRVGNSPNNGEYGVLPAGFTTAAEIAKVNFYSDATNDGTKAMYYDDIAFANFNQEYVSVAESNITDMNNVPTNIGSLKFKYSSGFLKDQRHETSRVKITETKNGVIRDVTNFTVIPKVNAAEIKFANDELKTRATYNVEFLDTIRSVFGQKVAPVTFTTDSTIVTTEDYYDFAGIANNTDAPDYFTSAEGTNTTFTKANSKMLNETVHITTPANSQYWFKQTFKKAFSSDKVIYSMAIKPELNGRERIFSLVDTNGMVGAYFRIKEDGGVFYNKTATTGALWEYLTTINLNDWNYITMLLSQSTQSYTLAVVDSKGVVKAETTLGKVDNRFIAGVKSSELYMSSKNVIENCYYDNIALSNYSDSIAPLKATVYNNDINIPTNTQKINLSYGTVFLKGSTPNINNMSIIETKYGISKNIECIVSILGNNEVVINMNSPLIAAANYRITFDNTVKTVFDQKPSDISFATAGQCDVESLVFKNIQGELKNDLSNMPQNLQNIEIIYKTDKTTEQLNNVVLKQGANIHAVTYTYDEITKKQVLSLEPLAKLTNYTLTIGTETVNIHTKDTSKLATFTMLKNETAVEQLTGLNNGDILNVKYSVSTDTGVDENVSLISCIYKTDISHKLVYTDIKEGVINKTNGKIDFDFNIQLPEFMTDMTKYEMKFIVLNTLGNLVPMFECNIISPVKPVIDEVFYPGNLKKAVTFSYDDGEQADARLIQEMNNNGVKGTFNLNSDKYFNYDLSQVQVGDKYDANKILIGNNVAAQGEARARYAGHEVANHVKWHPYMYNDVAIPSGFPTLTDAECIRYISEGREELQTIIAKPVTGLAWPYHAANRPAVLEYLINSGVQYARSIDSTGKFDMPTDWLQWQPTAHHNNSYALWNSFATLPNDGGLKLFSVWGHSYEFSANTTVTPPREDNWANIEGFLATVGSNSDVWKATNIEIVTYVKALDNIKIIGDRVYNPSDVDLYISVNGQRVVVPAQGSYNVSK